MKVVKRIENYTPSNKGRNAMNEKDCLLFEISDWGLGLLIFLDLHCLYFMILNRDLLIFMQILPYFLGHGYYCGLICLFWKQ
jgi:hypothetical protein